MIVHKTIQDDCLRVSLEGRLDTTTSPILEQELEDELSSVSSLVFDLEKLEYISSAGLRVFLAAYKKMAGNVIVVNPSCEVKEIFDLTGFSGFLTIKQEKKECSA